MHSVFLKSDGTVWAMLVVEFYGQLGDGTTTSADVFNPVQVVDLGFPLTEGSGVFDQDMLIQFLFEIERYCWASWIQWLW